MRTAIGMVREFHLLVGQPLGDQGVGEPSGAEIAQQVMLLKEEQRELLAAIEAGNLVEVADGLGDLAYVVIGTALSYGIPLDAVFAEVHRSNMTKQNWPDGWRVKRHPRTRKVLKPPAFESPNIEKILWP